MADLKRTPLFPLYEEFNAKTVDFGGWDLPVQFTGIKNEHEATRTKAGLFDVSHMGEISVSGPNSEAFLQKMFTNDLSKLTANRAQYTIMCYENGGTVDDLVVYKKDDEEFLLVVNAANTDKDFEWLQKHVTDGVEVKNISSDIVQLALQGPSAEKILQTLTETDLSEIKFFRFKDGVQFDGTKQSALVSRTGYTGEDGFEIYLDQSEGPILWKKILEAGKDEGVQPVGLGARDTLRFEATLALYGQELSPEITPIEAGLSFAVKTNKEVDFIGKEILKDQKENGADRKLVGIEMIEKGIPRHGYEVFKGEKKIGFVTSGTQSPTLKKNIGLAVIDVAYSEEGEELEVQVRKRRLKAKVVPTPFYKRK
ncbi:glycine cleavage system aminomethyltransferase GcvT [Salinibacillus xinjiangensis]|uniref:Aminomethyltransferase n=1 Tax=Salinibacillus xinjiangensis TaxID=1229268 RepID=A0A6G1X6L7_9BACI|nr:glycine cleavage system aminomethyltransferase GcvT [Salinibacillus xinjiangensis]MRG86569.1 glycine cleavage system aminomethyltransferase GcvT [Salinibacillus xinjiangensis]